MNKILEGFWLNGVAFNKEINNPYTKTVAIPSATETVVVHKALQLAVEGNRTKVISVPNKDVFIMHLRYPIEQELGIDAESASKLVRAYCHINYKQISTNMDGINFID
jgi:hypothetical protein